MTDQTTPDQPEPVVLTADWLRLNCGLTVGNENGLSLTAFVGESSVWLGLAQAEHGRNLVLEMRADGSAAIVSRLKGVAIWQAAFDAGGRLYPTGGGDLNLACGAALGAEQLEPLGQRLDPMDDDRRHEALAAAWWLRTALFRGRPGELACVGAAASPHAAALAGLIEICDRDLQLVRVDDPGALPDGRLSFCCFAPGSSSIAAIQDVYPRLSRGAIVVWQTKEAPTSRDDAAWLAAHFDPIEYAGQQAAGIAYEHGAPPLMRRHTVRSSDN